MNELFGIPMSGILVALLVLLALCLLSVAWVAWRRPVIFKMGVRNIPAPQGADDPDRRRPDAHDADHLGGARHRRYARLLDHVRGLRQLGHVDEGRRLQPAMAKATQRPRSAHKIDASSLATVEQRAGRRHRMSTAIMPCSAKSVPVVDAGQRSGRTERHAHRRRSGPDRASSAGSATRRRQIDRSGANLAAERASCSARRAADKLDASVGDTVTVYYDNRPHPSSRSRRSPRTRYLTGQRSRYSARPRARCDAARTASRRSPVMPDCSA